MVIFLIFSSLTEEIGLGVQFLSRPGLRRGTLKPAAVHGRRRNKMRTWVWILPLVILLAGAAATSEWSYAYTPQAAAWSDAEQTVADDPVGFSEFSAEWDEFFTTIRTTISTYVNTVVTVVTAVVGVIKTVVLAVAKLVVRFAFTIAKAAVQWLIAAIF
jgi:hypothetical protein